MSDRILVRNLVVHAYHGVLDEERRLGQRFEVDIDVRLDLREAAARDDVEATLSYVDLVGIAEEVSHGRAFRLIEALADEIARTILERHDLADTVTVAIRKPAAPIAAVFDWVGIEVTRDRRS